MDLHQAPDSSFQSKAARPRFSNRPSAKSLVRTQPACRCTARTLARPAAPPLAIQEAARSSRAQRWRQACHTALSRCCPPHCTCSSIVGISVTAAGCRSPRLSRRGLHCHSCAPPGYPRPQHHCSGIRLYRLVKLECSLHRPARATVAEAHKLRPGGYAPPPRG
jgi:hypothetical protein